MIRASQLQKVYADGTKALRGVDLSVDAGEILFIRGRSGAGKTTLFRLLLGMEIPSGGSLVVGDHSMTEVDGRSLRLLRRKMGVIFQDFRLIMGRTALENVEMGLRVLGITGTAMSERAREFLKRVELTHRADTPVDALSWGERQRVAAARALSRDPLIILADEPTGNLDEGLSAKVMDLLYEANERGATVLVATHASDVLAANHNRTITLSEGRIVAEVSGRDGDGGMGDA